MERPIRQTQHQTQGQVLQQTQTQQLLPLQVMTVRLTELPLDALEQRVEAECMENPWLEKQESPSQEEPMSPDEAGTEGPFSNLEKKDERAYDYRSDDDIPDYMLRTDNGTQRPENIEWGETLSFYDVLKSQIGEYDLNEHQTQVMEYLIGSLSEDGLLHKPLQQVADEMEIYHGLETSEEELEDLLKVLWQFDPPGIGARSLQESLLVQIGRLEDNPLAPLMKRVMTECFDMFMRNHWDRIRQTLGLNEYESEALQKEILRLNPKPGSSLGEVQHASTQQIRPDFLVETDEEGQITLTLNQGHIPPLVISPEAVERVETLQQRKSSLSKADMEDLRFTRSYVERGQLFLQAMKQRRESMLSIMQSIIRRQRPFFLEGDDSLIRPLRMADVAEETGYDVSTVSRVSNGKYVETAFGIFPLKHFFASGEYRRKRKGKNGAETEIVSSRKVMAVMQEAIDREDPAHPLSDAKLTQILNQQGFSIARRTVGKYRENMGLPVARLRKKR